MKMFLKDYDDRYLMVNDMDLVFTDEKDEAYNFVDVDTDEFKALKNYIEDFYEIELETIIE